MRLVYLDEAGIGRASQEPVVIVAGVIVHADRTLASVEEHIAGIVKRYIPSDQQHGFVFHAKELFNGGGNVFDRTKWPLYRRLEIADELAKIPNLFELPVVYGDKKRSNVVSNDHMVAFARCAVCIEAYMRNECDDEVCLLVVEDNAEHRSWIRAAQQYLQNRLMDPVDEEMSKVPLLPFRKIREDPLFAGKSPLSVLQVADFCAYVWKRKLMNDARYDRFCDVMDNRVVRLVDADTNQPF